MENQIPTYFVYTYINECLRKIKVFFMFFYVQLFNFGLVEPGWKRTRMQGLSSFLKKLV